jgi:RND family efflux transporter MFP subunit
MRQRLSASALALVLLTLACARAEKPEPNFALARVERREVPSEILASGVVRPEVGAEVNVGPRISGILKKLYVHVGEKVRVGQLLAELDARELEVAEAEAAAAVKQAEAEKLLAENQLRRREALAAAGLLAAEELEASRTATSLAAARLARAQAQLAASRIARAYAEIRAPIAGTVTSISTREGETVAASFAVPTFVTIVDLERLQVQVFVDETDVARVAPGQKVRLSVDAFPEQNFEGKVTAVIPQARKRENVLTFTVIVDITEGPRQLLQPDMSVSAAIFTGSRKQVLVVPSQAVQRDSEGQPYVLLLQAGKPTRRDIAVGEAHGDVVQVRSGLAEGDEVVLPSGEELKP